MGMTRLCGTPAPGRFVLSLRPHAGAVAFSVQAENRPKGAARRRDGTSTEAALPDPLVHL